MAAIFRRPAISAAVEPRTVVVIGQGYVGLTVAMRAVEVGHRVVGIELDSSRLDSLQSGNSYIDDIDDDTLRLALNSGRYRASADYSAASGFEIAVITVPTPLRDGIPDLTFIEQASASLSAHLSAGATVILESTTYPGTTDELLVPALERGSGLVAGRDFSVGYSPERIDPGTSGGGFVQTPKLVSGIDAASLESVRSFYDSLVDSTVVVSGTREAELAKLLENTFRHVNIALVNEMVIFAHELGVDLWESIDAASTKPFGFMRFTPGPGVGGHCLPVDPSYLSWQVQRRTGHRFRFIELANEINDGMPSYVIDRARALLAERGTALQGARIVIVGLAYKSNTSDTREAPALAIIEGLLRLGASVSAVDDRIDDARWPDRVARIDLTALLVAQSDLVVLVTVHDEIDLAVLDQAAVPVLDTRNRATGPTVEKL